MPLLAQLGFLEGGFQPLAFLGARLHLRGHLVDGVLHGRKGGVVLVLLAGKLLNKFFHGNAFRLEFAFLLQRTLLIIDSAIPVLKLFIQLINTSLPFLKLFVKRFAFSRMLRFDLPMLLLRLIYLVVQQ